MKKAALLFACLFTLLASSAQAAMIVNDHFDGNSLDPSWNIRTGGLRSYGATVNNSNLTVHYMVKPRKPYHLTKPYVGYSQQFDPVNDFETEFKLSWTNGLSISPRYGLFGLRLFDSDNDLVSALYYYDEEETSGQDYLRASYDGGSYTSYGDLPRHGSAIGSMIRQNGILSFYWDDVLLASTESLNQATKLELFFQFPNIRMTGSDRYLTRYSVDYITLESDPDLSATPEPGTMMLLGSALGLGGWWLRRRKRNK